MHSGILVSTTNLRPDLMSILKGLDDVSLLRQVVTTIAVDPEKPLGKCIVSVGRVLPSRWKRGIENRFVPDFLKGRVQSLYGREMLRIAAKEVGGPVFGHYIWLWTELGFDSEVARRFGGIYRCVYGMEHGSLETFTKQKESGGLCILHQVTVHGRIAQEIIKREIEKFPEYAAKYSRLYLRDAQRSIARKEREYGLADLIVANSQFVKDSFIRAGLNPEKIVSIPTGFPDVDNISLEERKREGPFIFLFVGALSLHKGLPYLIKAWNLLRPGKNAELWLVGSRELLSRRSRFWGDNVKYFGSVAHSKLDRIYQQADVFVLPSLVEGFANVLIEALAYGLPIITTKESGCGGFVQNGHNGFIISAADEQALCSAMEWCLEHRQHLSGMGRASLEQARGWTVTDSNRAHLAVIQKFLEEKGG